MDVDFNIIIQNKSNLNIKNVKSRINKWMDTNYAFNYGYEFQYLSIKPKIIAEKYIENIKKDIYDYKVFCFNGKAESILFIYDRKVKPIKFFFDLNWNIIVFNYTLNNEKPFY